MRITDSKGGYTARNAQRAQPRAAKWFWDWRQSRARQQAVARWAIIAFIATAPSLSRLGYAQTQINPANQIKSPINAGSDLQIQLRTHATDCTALTDGLAGEVCIELDSERLFSCQPTAGGCDTAGEWILTGDGGGTPAWEALVNTADTATAYASSADAETVTFDFQSAFSTDRFTIKSSVGNPTDGDLLTVIAHDPNTFGLRLDFPVDATGQELLVLECGATADQDCRMSFANRSGVDEWQVGKAANNNFYIVDVGNATRALFTKGGGTLFAVGSTTGDWTFSDSIGAIRFRIRGDGGVCVGSAETSCLNQPAASRLQLVGDLESDAADPADSGFVRVGNNEIGLAWELATPGADKTLTVDASDILQFNGTFNATALTEGGTAVPAAAADSTVGRVLRVTGADTYAFGALDLDDTDAFIGSLPGANVEAATTTAQGASELAIASEVDTGTDATRVMTPGAFADSTVFGMPYKTFQVFNSTDTVTTGDQKFVYPIPDELVGMNIVAVQAWVFGASSSGVPEIDLATCRATATGDACSGTVVDVLSTNITIDANESKSDTAAVAAVIAAANDDVQDGDYLRVDVDVAGTSVEGLWIKVRFAVP